MNSLSQSLSRFINLARKNILWTVATGIFVYLFWSLVQFIPSIPSRAANFQRHSVEMNLNKADGDRVIQLYTLLKDSVSSAREASAMYSATLGGVHVDEKVNLSALTKALAVNTTTRRSLASTIGTLNGMGFHDPKLDEYKKEFENDFRNLDDVFAAMQQTYFVKASGDPKQVSADLATLKIKILKHDEILTTLLSRVEAFSQEAQGIQANWVISVQEDTANLKWFSSSIYLSLAATCYETGFIIIALVSWLRHRRYESKRKPKPRRKH